MADATLDTLTKQVADIEAAILSLYDGIRHAKDNGYSYNELIAATRFSRGTVQNIADGRNPRFSVTNDDV